MCLIAGSAASSVLVFVTRILRTERRRALSRSAATQRRTVVRARGRSAIAHVTSRASRLLNASATCVRPLREGPAVAATAAAAAVVVNAALRDRRAEVIRLLEPRRDRIGRVMARSHRPPIVRHDSTVELRRRRRVVGVGRCKLSAIKDLHFAVDAGHGSFRGVGQSLDQAADRLLERAAAAAAAPRVIGVSAARPSNLSRGPSSRVHAIHPSSPRPISSRPTYTNRMRCDCVVAATANWVASR